MTNNTGANLFTIQFSSSSSEYEEEQKSDPLPPPPKNRSPVRMAPTRVYKQTINSTPIDLELSDSSYSTENEYSNKDHSFVKTGISPQLNDDDNSSFIDTGIELTPTNVQKHTQHYETVEIDEHSLINQKETSEVQWKPQNQSRNVTNQNYHIDNSQNTAQENSSSNFTICDDNQNSSNFTSPSHPTNNENQNKVDSNFTSPNVNKSPNLKTIQPKPLQQPQKIEQETTFQPTKNGLQSWPIYLISREKVMHLGGRRVQFTMSYNKQIKYTAFPSSSGNNPKRVFINHYPSKKTDTADALLSITRGARDSFSLTKSSDSNNEIMTIQISPPKTSADTARKLNVNFYELKEGTPARLMSKNPKLNPDGKPEHDFQGRFAIESVKNAVLIDRPNGPNMLYIRKAGKNEIEMEARFEHDALWVFAIGIASFLSHIK